MTPAPNAPPQQSSWFSRNWKWLLPVGCVVPIFCCGIFGAGTFLAVGAMVKGSAVTAQAVGKASANPEVQAKLGTPLTLGMAVSGSISEKNDTGEADYSVPLRGPKGEGTLVVKASKLSGGPWDFSVLVVEVGGSRIDLLSGAPTPRRAPHEELPADGPNTGNLAPTVDCARACTLLRQCKATDEAQADCIEGCETLVTPDVECAHAAADCDAYAQCIAQFD